MALNALFWERYFRKEFVPQIEALVDALERRVLPTFDDLENEAEQVSSDTWDAFMAAPGTGDEDLGDFAEAANDAGVAHYLLLSGIRQAMLNLFASALYHAFEQQVMVFHRRELLKPSEEDQKKKMTTAEFRTRLKNHTIDVEAFDSWPKIDELRLVANTVKHGEGSSSHQLHALRPGLFESPHLLSDIKWPAVINPRVFQPLAGEDLYVSLDDIKGYRDSVVGFWKELSAAMVKL